MTNKNSAEIGTQRPRAIMWIAIIILLTASRFTVAFSIPTLELLGGANSNAWLGPWVSDTLLGILAPFMAYFAWRQIGTTLWGLLIAYNAIGAFDYSQGLIAQWLHPQVDTPGAVIFIWIGTFMTIQIIAIYLLFRKSVRQHFMPAL